MKPENNSAIALILSVGILAILAMVAVAFSAFVRLELKAAENYANQLRAQLIAEAGISEAIDLLKYGNMSSYGTDGASIDPYDTSSESWFFKGNSSGDGAGINIEDSIALYPSFDNLNGVIGDGISGKYNQGTYKLKIVDCAALIDINAPLPDADSENDFKNTLTGLGLASQAQDLIDYRKNLPGGIFTSKEEIKLVKNIAQGTYSNIKNFITLFGDEDDGIPYLNKSSHSPAAGHTRKVFVNVNTAPKDVLNAVLSPMIAGDEETLANAIISRRSSNPFDGKNPDAAVTNFLSARGEFQRFLEYLRTQGIVASDADLTNLLKFTDPNRFDPADAATRSPTTYFSFDSGGYYEIESIGEYKRAKSKISKVVCIYHKIYQTTKQEFNNNRNFARVSMLDNVPVNIGACYSGYNYDISSARFINNAIKLGFWDDFSNVSYSNSCWRSVGDCWFDVEQDPSDAEFKLRTKALHSDGVSSKVIFNFPIITLGNELDSDDPWMLSDFYCIAHLEDETDKKKHNIRFDFPWATVPAGWDNPEFYEVFNEPNPNNFGVVRDQIFQEYMNTSQVLFRRAPHAWRQEGAAYIAQKQSIRKFTSTSDPSDDIDVESGWVDVWEPGAGEWQWHYFTEMGRLNNFGTKLVVANGDVFSLANCGYQPNKTLHLKVRGKMDPPVTDNNVWLTAFWPGGSQTVINTYCWRLPEAGLIALYGSENLPDMDNVRMIPEQGVYTSELFDPAESGGAYNLVKWATISATVSLPGDAQFDNEVVFLTTNFSANENVHAKAGPYLLPPVSKVPASGGAITAADTYPYLIYRAYLFSGYNETDPDYKDIPVIEDVTLTYMPKTRIVYQSKI